MKGMENWDDIGYIIRSRYRKSTFLCLYQPARPSDIAKKLHIRLTHVSRALKELEKKGFVKCLNPNEKIGRLYTLSDKGIALNGNVKIIS